MRLRPSRYGPFYGCDNYPECTATHGAHPDGKPLGIPANKETKQARIAAHAEFDRLWKGGLMTRKEAYKWMQAVMGLSAKTAHIGQFSKDRCELLVHTIKAMFPELQPSP